MFNLVDLTDRRILITGASSGIGKANALMLSRLGAKLVLVARREDKLMETLAELEGEGHGFYCADLSDVESIEPMVKELVATYGPFDGMVYAAGVGTSIPLKQFTPEKVQKVFDINFFGFVEMVRQLTKRGRYNPGMRMVGISSIAAQRGDKSHMAYSASKAAMEGALRCMAKELAPKEIFINAVEPAMTATEMYVKYLEKYGEDSGSNEELLKRQYLGIATTEQISSVVAFLISPAASFMTGCSIPVDGGLLSN